MTWLYMDGVFDLVHAGHFNAMRQASQLSQFLCVGVNDDQDVLYCKGYKPILQSAERASIIAACKWVDRVIDSTPYVTSLDFLVNGACCAAVAHGDDEVATTTGDDCYAEPRAAGLFKLFRRTDGISSTEVTARLRWAAFDLRMLPSQPDCSPMPMPVTTPISSGRLVKFARPNTKGNCFRCPIDLRKAVESEQLKSWCQSQPKAKAAKPPRVVYTQGAFDVLRGDQLDFLEHCKKDENTYLIVGILSDAACAALDPENRHCPILGVSDRMLNLLALRVVDEVICNVTWALDPSLLNAHQVEEVILPQNSERVLKLMPATHEGFGKVPVLVQHDRGMTVNDLRITLEHFSKCHSCENEKLLKTR